MNVNKALYKALCGGGRLEPFQGPYERDRCVLILGKNPQRVTVQSVEEYKYLGLTSCEQKGSEKTIRSLV